MKKLFLLLAVVFAFVACDDDENTVYDFSQMPYDEVITSVEGVEWLIAQQKIDWDAFVADVERGTLHNDPWMKDWVFFAGRWIEACQIDGPRLVAKVVIVMDDHTYRHCYSPMPMPDEGPKDLYRECNYVIDPETHAITITDGKSTDSVKLLYYSNGIGIAEVQFSRGLIVRMNLRFYDDREEMLNAYVAEENL